MFFATRKRARVASSFFNVSVIFFIFWICSGDSSVSGVFKVFSVITVVLTGRVFVSVSLTEEFFLLSFSLSLMYASLFFMNVSIDVSLLNKRLDKNEYSSRLSSVNGISARIVMSSSESACFSRKETEDSYFNNSFN